MSSNNIFTAVRLRPFSKNEIKANEKNIITMNGSETKVECNGKENTFNFDHSLWSFDGFSLQKNGYAEPKSPGYIDQKCLFDKLGRGILDNAWKGYNCTLFAYGQTGSGKTYSVMGYAENKGLIPLICKELFDGIDEKIPTLKSNEKFQVSMGVLEIYNEKLRDLLNPNNKESLALKQDIERGFYAPSQLMLRVNSYTEILQKMQLANKQRTIASTNMNETSSRAHTVVTLQFVQILTNAKNNLTTKMSLINLVDLAGSEKIKKSGSEGDRMFEAQKINQSLSFLGNCLRALSKRKSHIPYRDSVLTKLLMNALGGNSKTVLLVTISPSAGNYEETLSTLRFAERAKTIVTNAKINVSETNKIIKNLQEENMKLLQMLKELETKPGKEVPVENTKRILELQEQIDRNSTDVNDMKNSYKEQLEQAKAEIEKHKKEEEIQRQKLNEFPHIYNLNDDPSLNKVLVYFFDKDKTVIGSSKAMQKLSIQENIDIDINGIDILPVHAEIRNDKINNKLTLKPFTNANVLLNGERITEEKEINNFDRILFGNSLFFFLFDPKKALESPERIKEPTIDSARQEVTQKTDEFKNMENERLLDELSKFYPLVQEANSMASEMNKKVVYNIVIFKESLPGYNSNIEPKIVVRVFVTKKRHEYFLDLDEFSNRRFVMIDMYNEFIDGEKNSNNELADDPFIPNETYPVCIGFTEIYLVPLIHYLDISDPMVVINFKGDNVGEMNCQINLCQADWSIMEVKDEELQIGQNVFIKIILKNFSFNHASFIGFSRIYCRFKLEEKLHKTSEAYMKDLKSDFNTEFKIERKPIDDLTLDFLKNKMLDVEIWGYYGDSSSNAANGVQSGLESNDPEMSNFIANLAKMVQDRKNTGHKSIKISSLMKIAPGKYSNKATTAVCSIQ